MLYFKRANIIQEATSNGVKLSSNSKTTIIIAVTIPLGLLLISSVLVLVWFLYYRKNGVTQDSDSSSSSTFDAPNAYPTRFKYNHQQDEEMMVKRQEVYHVSNNSATQQQLDDLFADPPIQQEQPPPRPVPFGPVTARYVEGTARQSSHGFTEQHQPQHQPKHQPQTDNGVALRILRLAAKKDDVIDNKVVC
ncbi:hypothetical protein CANARDRAFT_26999 [[Candida] arabinofermentans NRRL YB-2248]|uniref:Uncharacterized protein n=1 Tax=[Candida] arabinofermentans NRRL YB-2248 TaxID=983967 RepID=A0A1E4T798_9ASCO|nr:hypothetical protein CANARDRAFT_26999 [[Candida] arabinofermentans NRRL YB-2248]